MCFILEKSFVKIEATQGVLDFLIEHKQIANLRPLIKKVAQIQSATAHLSLLEKAKIPNFEWDLLNHQLKDAIFA